MTTNNVAQFYRTVIDDVVNNVRETFLDDGIDEQVLLELKQVWESKIAQSKSLSTENDASTRESESSIGASASAAVAAALDPAKKIGANAAAAVAASTVALTNVQYQYTTAVAGQAGEQPKTVTITLPSQVTAAGQKPVTITLPAHLMQNAQPGGIIMSTSATNAAQALPPGLAAGLLQQQLTRVITQQQPDGSTVSYQAVTAEQLAKQGYVVSMAPRTIPTTAITTPVSSTPTTTQNSASNIIQLDGAYDTSDEDDDDDDLRDDDNDPDDDDDKNDDNEAAEEEVDSDPLNSEDDVSDEDPSELFDTDNVIVCQYDKITRSRNKWKFHLKDGIMNLQGKDYIFQKAIGDAEW